MKTILDFIKLTEDAMPTNTISSGAIATKEVPIGMAKRKKPLLEGEICPLCGTNHQALDISPKAQSFDGVVPLATVYAPDCYLPTEADIQNKRKSDMI